MIFCMHSATNVLFFKIANDPDFGYTNHVGPHMAYLQSRITTLTSKNYMYLMTIFQYHIEHMDICVYMCIIKAQKDHRSSEK